MNFCKECGRERTKNALYCKHCGARADEERASDQAAGFQRAMKRKRIIIMAAIAACLILLFAGYKTGEALTSIPILKLPSIRKMPRKQQNCFNHQTWIWLSRRKTSSRSSII